MRHWGEMRLVLRDGRTEGRVDLDDALGPNTYAVGALEGLAAEITVLGGVAQLAEVLDSASPDGLHTRAVIDGDRATLLIAADVAEWNQHSIEGVANLDELETRIGLIAAAEGIESVPFPFRVEGTASRLDLHVLDHSCPIAHPDGPSPWRFSGEDEPATLVGFYAKDAGGILTHHGQATHTHAVLPQRGISGHLDEVSFASGARLYLPLR